MLGSSLLLEQLRPQGEDLRLVRRIGEGCQVGVKLADRLACSACANVEARQLIVRPCRPLGIQAQRALICRLGRFAPVECGICEPQFLLGFQFRDVKNWNWMSQGSILGRFDWAAGDSVGNRGS